MNSQWGSRVGVCRLQPSFTCLAGGVVGLATMTAGYYLYCRYQASDPTYSNHVQAIAQGNWSPGLNLESGSLPSPAPHLDLGLGMVSFILTADLELVAVQALDTAEVFIGPLLPWEFSPLYCGPVAVWTWTSSCGEALMSTERNHTFKFSWTTTRASASKRTEIQMRSVCMVRGADTRLWWAMSVEKSRLTPNGFPYVVTTLTAVSGVQLIGGRVRQYQSHGRTKTDVNVPFFAERKQTDVSGMVASMVVGPDGIMRTTARPFWISKNTRTRGEDDSSDDDDDDDEDEEDDDSDEEWNEEEEEEWDEDRHRSWAQDQDNGNTDDVANDDNDVCNDEEDIANYEDDICNDEDVVSNVENFANDEDDDANDDDSNDDDVISDDDDVGNDDDEVGSDYDDVASEDNGVDTDDNDDIVDDDDGMPELTAEELEIPCLNYHLTSRGFIDLPLRLAALRKAFTMLLTNPDSRSSLCEAGRLLLGGLATAANKEEEELYFHYDRLLAYVSEHTHRNSIIQELALEEIRHLNVIDVVFELVLQGMMEEDRRRPAVTVSGGFIAQLYGLLETVLPEDAEEDRGETYLKNLKKMLMDFLEAIFSLPADLYSCQHQLVAELQGQVERHLHIMITSLLNA